MLWRNAPAPRGGRQIPEGFVQPCQAVLHHKVPTGPEWIHELKYDGFRLICRKVGDRVKIWTRPGNERSAEFAAITEALREIPGDFVIDGEGSCQKPSGHCDFFALRSSTGKARAKLIAFDLISRDGEDLRPLPLEMRRLELTKMIGLGATGPLCFSQHFDGADGQILFDHACANNLEGIISKKLGTRYKSGPHDAWRKIKCGNYQRV